MFIKKVSYYLFQYLKIICSDENKENSNEMIYFYVVISRIFLLFGFFKTKTRRFIFSSYKKKTERLKTNMRCDI